MQYKKIQAKSALHVLKRKLPYGLDLNIYRGCEHACQYCFAMYSHKYMQSEGYFDEIYIKEGLAPILDMELSKRKNKEIINIGGVCDSYQQIEAKMKLMPDILKIIIKHQYPIIISTKSDLILRDIELINELSQLTTVNIAATITTIDENVREIIEPGTVSTERRFKMLERIRKETNATVGVHIMPIIPYITDSNENLEGIYRRASEINATYVLPGTLYLRGKTRDVFFDMVDSNFKDLKPQLTTLYSYNFDRKPYKANLYTRINTFQKMYNLTSNYKKLVVDKALPKQAEQLSLF